MLVKNLNVVKTGFISEQGVKALMCEISEHYHNDRIEVANRPMTMQLHHSYDSVLQAYDRPSTTKLEIEKDILDLMEHLNGEDYGVDSRNGWSFTASFKVNDYKRMLTYFITFTKAHTILWI